MNKKDDSLPDDIMNDDLLKNKSFEIIEEDEKKMY